MPHVTVSSPRRHDRARAAVAMLRAPVAPRALRLSPLNAVSLQVTLGLVGPLPFIQLGHWLFGWPSVAVMFGGLQ